MLKVKPRLYQEKLFAKAVDENTLIVLPTGLGKTLIALMMTLHYLKKGKVLIMAPTKPLVEQHMKSFKKDAGLDGVLVTGAVKPEERTYKEQLIFATPQTIRNDLLARRLDLSDFSLVVFDECLTSDSKVLLSNGVEKPIKEVVNEFHKGKTVYVKSYDKKQARFVNQKVVGAQKIPCFKRIIEVSLDDTSLKSTVDHPYLVRRNNKVQWVKAGNLSLTDEVAYLPFSKLSNNLTKELVSDQDIIKTYSEKQQKNIELYKKVIYLRRKYKKGYRVIANELGCSERNISNWIYSKSKPLPLKVVDEMNAINLLPFSYSNPIARLIARIVGFVYGDGWFSKNKSGSFVVGFSGLSKDLKLIQEDLKLLGLKYSNIFSRRTHSRVKDRDINGTTNSFTCSDKRLVRLLSVLGIPVGKMVSQEVRVPKWVMNSPNMVKKEFLSALFGSDMGSPKIIKGSCCFNPIRFAFYKRSDLVDNALDYAYDIKTLLSNLGVKVSSIKQLDGNIWSDKKTKTKKFLITLSNSNNNFFNFFKNVSYAYNIDKQRKALSGLKYLLKKKKLMASLQQRRTQAINLKNKGFSNKIISNLLDLPVWRVERLNYDFSKAPDSFVKYGEWIDSNNNGLFWKKIIKLGVCEDEDFVYDLTVEGTHNFVANNIVVHNCHKAVGDYAYVFIASQYEGRVLGLSASPGSDSEKIKEVCFNLKITGIESRTENSSDVKQYLNKKDVTNIHLELPDEFKEIIKFLKRVYSTTLKEIKDYGALSSVSNIYKRDLLALQRESLNKVKEDPSYYKILSLAAKGLKITHALELLQTQGVKSLTKYFDGMKHQSSKAARELLRDHNFQRAMNVAFKTKVEHPKLKALLDLMKDDETQLIFTQYRATAEQITKLINDQGGNARLFVGQQGKSGMTQKKQLAVLQQFREGEFKTLVSTSISEEGLDIPSIDTAIFFEPVPSALRMVQRRGRVGRAKTGKVYVLITKGTVDEKYKWVAYYKEKRMRKAISNISKEDLSQATLSTFL